MTTAGENRGTQSGSNAVVVAPRRGGLLVTTLTGAVVGAVLSMFMGPKVVSWLYEPTGREAVSCHGPVSEALFKFVWIQIAVTVVVSLSFLVAVLLFQRRGRQG